MAQLWKLGGEVAEYRIVQQSLLQAGLSDSILCVLGGRADLNTYLEEMGFPTVIKDGLRVFESPEHKKAAATRLEHRAKRYQRRFAGTLVRVRSPYIVSGPIVIALDGDEWARLFYRDFTLVKIFALAERAEAKQRAFLGLPVTVVGVTEHELREYPCQ